jgi:hypothetical protein
MEQVNHPQHYSKQGRKECIVEMQDRFGAYITIIFDLTNCYKYLYRAGDKPGNDEGQDIDKALWYYNHAMSLYKADVKLTGNEYKLLSYIRRELKKYD